MSSGKGTPPRTCGSRAGPGAERHIHGLVADIARHETAAPQILAYGTGAVPALAGFLNRPPESVPQARRFAVAMLASIPGIEATAALRRTLHRHDLKDLAPNLARSEWLVQNDAFATLVGRLGQAVGGEIDYGLVIARLPAAVEAVGQLALTGYVPTVAAMLADDILADPAYRALAQFGEAALPVLLDILRQTANDVSALKQRLAAIELVAQVPSAPRAAALTPLLTGVHPALAAAAAVALVQARGSIPPAKLAAALTRGALLPEPSLAERALDGLAALPADCLAEPAMTALAQPVTPDFYGDPHQIRETARARLLAQILSRPGVNPRLLLPGVSQTTLLAALRQLSGPLPKSMRLALQKHPSRPVREVASRFGSRRR